MLLCALPAGATPPKATSGETSPDPASSPGAICALRGALAHAVSADPALDWPTLRAACNAEIVRAKAADPIGDTWFRNAANGFAGTPLVLMKLLPSLAPEIWGPAEDDFARFGLFADPDDPGRILPRGVGVAGTGGRPLDAQGRPTGEIDYGAPQLLVVTLACGACHTGSLAMPDGTRVALDGAPNTQFDVRKWRGAFIATAERHMTAGQIGTADAPGETTTRLLALLDAAPQGTFAAGLPGLAAQHVDAVDAGQRAAFRANVFAILSGFAEATAVRAAAVALQQKPGSSYGHGARSPGLAGFSAGQSDGSGDLMADLLAARAAAGGDTTSLLEGPLPPQMPPFATVTDIPSVWNQADRSVGQWDGSVLTPFWRNIAAALPIVGVPDKVDLTNAALVGEYLKTLPPAPYPFDVDIALAAKGEALFDENCGTCHRPRNAARYPEVATDMNRARVLSPEGAALFLAAFRQSCADPNFRYVDSAGRTVRPCVAPPYEILRDTVNAGNQGYLAPPLDGIWARAPYLHNGSVPTLRHLLEPATRPATFLRGAQRYDSANVGFAWDPRERDDLSGDAPTMSIHDTSRDGWTNVGHDRNLVIDGKLHRLDWSGAARQAERNALIEYLKTQ